MWLKTTDGDASSLTLRRRMYRSVPRLPAKIASPNISHLSGLGLQDRRLLSIGKLY
jgi:hypothetical protein